MAYTVKLPIFEGPFDLLLHLIKIDEMNIYDIPIADVVEKYLEYVEQLQTLDLDAAGEFLVIASQLVSMKAKTLLPMAENAEEAPEDEEGDALFGGSPREFMRQLVAYRKFKDMARELSEREIEQTRVVYRTLPPPARPEPVEEVEEGPQDLQVLLDAFSRVLRYVDRQNLEHRVLAENYTVEEKILHFEQLLLETPQVDIMEEFGRCFHKVEMVVTFLAVLELVRLKRIRVRQDESFGHIQIEAIQPDAATAAADEEATASA